MNENLYVHHLLFNRVEPYYESLEENIDVRQKRI